MVTSLLGTLGLGVSSEDPPPKQELALGGLTTVLRLGLCFLILGAAVLYGSRRVAPGKRKQPPASGASASIHGLQVDPPPLAKLFAAQGSRHFRKFQCNEGRKLLVCH